MNEKIFEGEATIVEGEITHFFNKEVEEAYKKIENHKHRAKVDYINSLFKFVSHEDVMDSFFEPNHPMNSKLSESIRMFEKEYKPIGKCEIYDVKCNDNIRSYNKQTAKIRVILF